MLSCQVGKDLIGEHFICFLSGPLFGAANVILQQASHTSS